VLTVDTSDEYVFGNEWYVEEHFVEGRSGRTKVDGMYCRPSPSLEHVVLTSPASCLDHVIQAQHPRHRPTRSP